ncbi:MAG: hypothetical protein ACRDSK_08580, partial [Actinophytocola sp.]
ALPGPPVPPPRGTDNSRRNLVLVAVAALLVVAGVVTAIVLRGGEEPGESVSEGGVDRETTQPAQPDEPSTAPPSSADANPIPANGDIDFSQAGQLVIDYYGDVQNNAKRFAMLSTNAQQQFGGQEGFSQYWGQFTEVSSQNASNVTKNADGSVNVPVDVTYTKGDSPSTQKQQVRVTRVNGKLVIDSAAR